ncbi:MAG: tail fiber domain-containing protein [Clostridiales Family XIII bacterium]|jgi:hypothetical protein|nr:tail fiber domain-containing protein [Clostridiales Family XIII bacterium]
MMRVFKYLYSLIAAIQGYFTSGVLKIANGGTGAATAAAARSALGLGAAATLASPIPILYGGTGASLNAPTAGYSNVLKINAGAAVVTMDPVKFSTARYSMVQINGSGALFGTDLYGQTSSSAANVYVDSGGSIYRVASSSRYKALIQDADIDPGLLLRLRPRTWVDKTEYENAAGNGDGPAGLQRHCGLIAEEVEAAGGGAFVVYDGEGHPDALSYDRLAIAAVAACRGLEARIAALEARLQA